MMPSQWLEQNPSRLQHRLPQEKLDQRNRPEPSLPLPEPRAVLGLEPDKLEVASLKLANLGPDRLGQDRLELCSLGQDSLELGNPKP